MSHEKLSPSEPEKALQTYNTAIPILTIVESEIPRTLPATGTGKLDFSSFTRFRELWLWIERLLWRAIILASRTCALSHIQNQTTEDTKLLWKLFSHYRTCSIYWPNKFNTEHRSTVAVLHLRALVLRARILSSSAPERSSLDVDKPPPGWLSDARSVVQEYRAILGVSAGFPKAGARNVKVEDFVDLCVAVWEAGGAIGDHAGWVIDVSSFPVLHILNWCSFSPTDLVVGYASHLQFVQDLQAHDARFLRFWRFTSLTTYFAALCPSRE